MSAVMTNDERRRQRQKNLAVGGLVALVCLLFFLLTIVRMGRL
jgi:predicted nucleic acid-binding Zn ribbon protein